MKTAIVVMTILGCGHGETECEYIKTVEATWPSAIECQAQAGMHLKASIDANYPNVIAVCVEKTQPVETVAEPAEPEVLGDVIVRKAGVLDRIYDGLPDVDDAQAAAFGLINLTRSGASTVSRWLW